METIYKIYKESIKIDKDGVEKTITNEIGTTTMEQLQKDLAVCIQQKDKSQLVVDLINQKINLIGLAGATATSITII